MQLSPATIVSNEFIASKLKEVAKQRQNRGETYPARAHNKAAAMVLKHPTPILSYNDAIKIAGVGKSIAAKIQEIIETQNLECLKSQNEIDTILETFTKIWGVGPAAARMFYEEGYRSIQDLRQSDISFNAQQKIGLKHFEDIQQKMNRSQMEEVLEFFQAVLQNVNPNLNIEIVGSYRRGGKESKDIDLLLWPKAGVDIADDELHAIPAKIRAELLKVDGEILSCGENQLFVVLDFGIWRRVDIFIAKHEEYACAMLAHTGPALHNVNLRALAIEKGWLLNEKGLFDAQKNRIATATEDDVYVALGLKPLQPENRN